MKPAELVHQILGVRPLAKKLHRTAATVQNWAKGDGLVPSKYHRKILELADGKLTPHDLIYGRD